MSEVPAFKNEIIQTLTDLGLSLLQAKVYLALSKLKMAKVKTISKASHVARQDIYRIMSTLEHLGLAEREIATPVRYRAIPLKTGISILIQKRTQEFDNLLKKTKHLLNFISDTEENEFSENGSELVLTSGKKTVKRKMHFDLESIETSVEAIGPFSFLTAILDESEIYSKLISEGVKIRLIIGKNEDEKVLLPILQTLKKNPLFKVRYLSYTPPVTLVICDRKKVDIVLSQNTSTEMNNLGSTNPVILKLATSYFDEMWTKSMKKAKNEA